GARSRSGDLLRAQGTLRHQGRGPRGRAGRSARHRQGPAAGQGRHAGRAGRHGAARAAGGFAAGGRAGGVPRPGGPPRAPAAGCAHAAGRDEKDRAPLHGGGESAPVRLGGGDRLPRRRGGFLRSRRPGGAHHHAPRAAARGRRPRGQRRAHGGAHRADGGEDRRLMQVIMPQLGETVAEGTVTAWRKKVGDRVEAGEALFDVSTDKVETEGPAPASGVLTAILVPQGTTVKVGAALATIGEAGAESIATPAAAEEKLSPVVRKLLAENGLQASEIQGTGADGRITRRDVLDYLERRKPAAAASDERVPLGPIRKRTAEQMALSWRTIP